MELILYAKAGCHLCEEAHDTVQQVRATIAPAGQTRLTVVDITTSAELMAQYRFDIPVLLVDGRPEFRHRVDADRLRSLIARAAA